MINVVIGEKINEVIGQKINVVIGQRKKIKTVIREVKTSRARAPTNLMTVVG